MTTQTQLPTRREGSPVAEPARVRPVERRVRHDVAAGAAVMAFSLTVSVALAGAVAILLSALGGSW